MDWPLLKTVLKQTLGCRTLTRAFLAALGGAAGIGLLGMWLCRHALTGTSADAHSRVVDGCSIVIYGLVGGCVAFISVILGAAARAGGELRPLIRPGVEKCAAAAVSQIPATVDGIEIARIESFCAQVCDAAVVEVPVFRHVSSIASAFAHRRLQRRLDLFLAPLRETGQPHVNATTLQRYATDAGTSALIDLARDQITRPRLIGWLAVLGLLIVPALLWAYRAFS